MTTILPVRHQPPLPLDRIIRRDPPGAEAIEMDVLIVGAGPAGLACAIELARLVKRARDGGGEMPEVNIGVGPSSIPVPSLNCSPTSSLPSSRSASPYPARRCTS